MTKKHTPAVREIVVISGKGGTGKTSLTASFSVLGGASLVTVDCDVDAADMHLLLEPDFAVREAFYSGQRAVIDREACLGCGRCARICRFGAIHPDAGRYSVTPLDCEGCGYCARICPADAIRMEEQLVGECSTSSIRTGGKMVHARLNIGAENSGKLVARVKTLARELAAESGKDLILVDGSPGIGCPVISSLSGATYVVLVTEATVSGLHDLQRVHELVRKFNIPAGCILNKADLNPIMAEKIRAFLGRQGVQLLCELGYDESFSKAMTSGRTVAEAGSAALRETVGTVWKRILAG